jgi:hypothetical protein
MHGLYSYTEGSSQAPQWRDWELGGRRPSATRLEGSIAALVAPCSLYPPLEHPWVRWA